MDRKSQKIAAADKVYTQLNFSNCCTHCGRKMNDFAGGYSRGYNNERLCHPNVANRPDCYALVTRYQHPTPCDSVVCYEDHAELLTYVDGRINASQTTTTAGPSETPFVMHPMRDSNRQNKTRVLGAFME